MNSRFRIAFARLPLLVGLAFAACKRSQEVSDQGADGRLRAADGHAEEKHECSSVDEDRALQLVDAARALTGVPAFACLAPLSSMASAHAAFLAKNESLGLTSGHREQAGADGYTGDTLGERAAFQKLDVRNFWLSEGVGGGKRPDDVVASHLATVYHRSALLSPGGRYFAFAVEQGQAAHAVMNMLLWVTVDGLHPSRWPAVDAVDVPARFNGSGEKPEPIPGAGDAGFPVSVHFPRYLDADGNEPLVVVERFELQTSAGEAVETVRLDHATDEAVFRSDAFLVPKLPLRDGATYVVTARMSYGEFTFDDVWSFRVAQGAGVLRK